ncbi:MAG TPA: hypothetical protein VNS49_23880, partial [Streptomyces sp.]|nr:hypothetical protein [Streptomyces sp.]
MTQQGRPRGPHSGEQDDWWSQLYDPGSPDTGRSRAGDTLDDRYASVRRTMGAVPAAPSRNTEPEAEPEPEPEPPPVEPTPTVSEGVDATGLTGGDVPLRPAHVGER